MDEPTERLHTHMCASIKSIVMCCKVITLFYVNWNSIDVIVCVWSKFRIYILFGFGKILIPLLKPRHKPINVDFSKLSRCKSKINACINNRTRGYK